MSTYGELWIEWIDNTVRPGSNECRHCGKPMVFNKTLIHIAGGCLNTSTSQSILPQTPTNEEGN